MRTRRRSPGTDANNNLLEVDDPDWNYTWAANDALNRTVSTGVDNRETDTTYDASTNNPVTVTLHLDAEEGLCNPLGKVTTYGYDAAGRLTSATNPGQGASTYTYDADGNTTAQISPSGTTKTTWTYDANGRLATQVDPNGNTPGRPGQWFTNSDAEGPRGSTPMKSAATRWCDGALPGIADRSAAGDRVCFGARAGRGPNAREQRRAGRCAGRICKLCICSAETLLWHESRFGRRRRT